MARMGTTIVNLRVSRMLWRRKQIGGLLEQRVLPPEMLTKVRLGALEILFPLLLLHPVSRQLQARLGQAKSPSQVPLFRSLTAYGGERSPQPYTLDLPPYLPRSRQVNLPP